jgi:phage FluMu gp28-like protein
MQIAYKRPFVTEYQRRIIDSPARFTVTAASTKTGKTASHIIWDFEQALQLKANQRVWWVAPVYQQAEIAFNRMRSQVTVKNFFKVNETKLRLTLPTGAIMEFKSAEKPDNLYGDDVYAAVFDEFTRAREEAWFALRSTLTKTQGKCKFIGNVKGKKNWGYKLAERAKAGEKDYEFHKITAWDAVEAGILSREEVLQAQRDLPPHVFSELYLAEPTEDGSNPFGLTFIQNCIKPLSTKPAQWYGVDLAKYTDWTVIVGLDEDLNVCYFERFQMDWAQTEKRIIEVVQRTPAMIDSTGVGDPVVEKIQRSCPKVVGVKFTSTNKQQMMEQLTGDVHAALIGFPEGVLADEMRNFEFEQTATGMKYSAPSGLHDDSVCALALARMCSIKNRKGIFVII